MCCRWVLAEVSFSQTDQLQLTLTSDLTEGRGEPKKTWHISFNHHNQIKTVCKIRESMLILGLWLWSNTREREHDMSGQRGKRMMWSRCTTEKTRWMGGEGKQGMKRDEETVCRDFKGEEGWGKAAEKERSEELVIERLAAQSVSGLFSRRPWRGDLSGATSFWAERCRSGRPPGEKVWHDH